MSAYPPWRARTKTLKHCHSVPLPIGSWSPLVSFDRSPLSDPGREKVERLSGSPLSCWERLIRWLGSSLTAATSMNFTFSLSRPLDDVDKRDLGDDRSKSGASGNTSAVLIAAR